MNRALEAYIPMCEALKELFHPFVEVQLVEGQAAKKPVPYYRRTVDGKRLKCTQVPIRDKENRPIGLMDIRVDTTLFGDVQRLLGSFLSLAEEPKETSGSMEERVMQVVDSFLKERTLRLERLKRTDKRALVQELHQKGIFSYKLAVPFVADVLGLSRATIYNYVR